MQSAKSCQLSIACNRGIIESSQDTTDFSISQPMKLDVVVSIGDSAHEQVSALDTKRSHTAVVVKIETAHAVVSITFPARPDANRSPGHSQYPVVVAAEPLVFGPPQ